MVPFDELGILIFFELGADDERSRRRVKDLIALLDEMHCILIVIF